MHKTATDIDNELTEGEKILLQLQKDRDTIELSILDKRREKDKLTMEIRDLETTLIKAKCLERERKAKNAELSRERWHTPHSGL